VSDQTEALLYIQAPHKVDMSGNWSYQLTWPAMWRQAIGFAVPEKVTPQEKNWQTVVDAAAPELSRRMQAEGSRDPKWQPARLEWARKLTALDMEMLDGTVKFDREADADAIAKLKLLRGHLRKGQWVTKFRKTFRKGEMGQDIELVPAALNGKPDEMEYAHILPTSPP
jgi:hypothetical protein